jgi:hypothetical protein
VKDMARPMFLAGMEVDGYGGQDLTIEAGGNALSGLQTAIAETRQDHLRKALLHCRKANSNYRSCCFWLGLLEVKTFAGGSTK